MKLFTRRKPATPLAPPRLRHPSITAVQPAGLLLRNLGLGVDAVEDEGDLDAAWADAPSWVTAELYYVLHENGMSEREILESLADVNRGKPFRTRPQETA